jgi:hypothetical protein
MDTHTEADSRALAQSTLNPKPINPNPKPMDTHTEADSRALVQSTVPLFIFWFWINLCVYAESIKLQTAPCLPSGTHSKNGEIWYKISSKKLQPSVVGMSGCFTSCQCCGKGRLSTRGTSESRRREEEGFNDSRG